MNLIDWQGPTDEECAAAIAYLDEDEKQLRAVMGDEMYDREFPPGWLTVELFEELTGVKIR